MVWNDKDCSYQRNIQRRVDENTNVIWNECIFDSVVIASNTLGKPAYPCSCAPKRMASGGFAGKLLPLRPGENIVLQRNILRIRDPSTTVIGHTVSKGSFVLVLVRPSVFARRCFCGWLWLQLFVLRPATSRYSFCPCAGERPLQERAAQGGRGARTNLKNGTSPRGPRPGRRRRQPALGRRARRCLGGHKVQLWNHTIVGSIFGVDEFCGMRNEFETGPLTWTPVCFWRLCSIGRGCRWGKSQKRHTMEARMRPKATFVSLCEKGKSARARDKRIGICTTDR